MRALSVPAMSRLWRVVSILAVGTVGVSCLFLATRPGRTQDEKALSEWLQAGKLLCEWDFDQDEKIDTWAYDPDGDSAADLWVKFFEERVPEGIQIRTRWEKDRNHDGKMDWYMEALVPPGTHESPVKSIAEDRDYDGEFDYSASLKGGKKTTHMCWYDTDGDGKLDKSTMDRDGDGRVDYETRFYFLERAAQANASTDPRGFNYSETDWDMDGVASLFRVFGALGWEEVNQSLLGIPS